MWSTSNKRKRNLEESENDNDGIDDDDDGGEVVVRERSISNKGSSSRCEASDTPQRSLRAFCSSSKDDSPQTILHHPARTLY